MSDFDTLQPSEQKKFLLAFLSEQCKGAVPEGETLHYTGQALHVSVEFGQVQSRENKFLVQVLFILKHDWFDEDFVTPLSSLGDTLEEAMKVCTAEFAETVLKNVLETISNHGSETITSEIIHQKYLFHVPEKKLPSIKATAKPLTYGKLLKINSLNI